MALTPRLELRQGQSLVMTPQLQQAIKLLQLSNLELGTYLEEELLRNPLLERADGEDQGGGDAMETGAENPDPESAPEVDPSVATDVVARDETGTADAGGMDLDYDNLWNNDGVGDIGLSEPAFASWGMRGGDFEGSDDLEHTVSGTPSLREHLSEQINIELADPADRLIAHQLAERLDEAGYLIGDAAEVAATLGCPEDRVVAVIDRLQHFDPTGIFARDLAECLALQLRELNRLDPAMQALLDHLDLLAKRDIGRLLKVTGVDEDDLTDMVAEIRALNPKPAQAFDTGVAQLVVPDVLMQPRPDGGWIVELNSETLPRVLVNNRYYARISGATRNREERQFVETCLQSANWLTKSLHQRATTILKVATEIVRQQDGFFVHGVSALKPLVLRDIAQAIEMHESTVSRVTSNKFIATPRGIFELKYFFTAAIANASGEGSVSAESVRYRIKELIDRETPDAVLSDDKIVDILVKEGMDIARRTIAKYREAMGIPSSVQRRRLKSSRI